MSFTDRLVLWLHIAFAIFTIGPVTLAIMSTPRYIRKRNLAIVRYLYGMTRLFTVVSLAVLIAGLVLAQLLKVFSKPWVSISITLFVVAIVLLVLIWRDQHRAISALQAAAKAEAGPVGVRAASQAGEAPRTATGTAAQAGAADAGPDGQASGSREAGGPGTVTTPSPPAPGTAPVAASVHLASVERGRITTMGGIVSVIWLVILVLMIWHG